MKLKLDENIDPRAKEILVQAGHDVLTVPEEAVTGLSDDVVGAAASREGHRGIKSSGAIIAGRWLG